MEIDIFIKAIPELANEISIPSIFTHLGWYEYVSLIYRYKAPRLPQKPFKFVPIPNQTEQPLEFENSNDEYHSIHLFPITSHDAHHGRYFSSSFVDNGRQFPSLFIVRPGHRLRQPKNMLFGSSRVHIERAYGPKQRR